MYLIDGVYQVGIFQQDKHTDLRWIVPSNALRLWLNWYSQVTSTYTFQNALGCRVCHLHFPMFDLKTKMFWNWFHEICILNKFPYAHDQLLRILTISFKQLWITESEVRNVLYKTIQMYLYLTALITSHLWFSASWMHYRSHEVVPHDMQKMSLPYIHMQTDGTLLH